MPMDTPERVLHCQTLKGRVCCVRGCGADLGSFNLSSTSPAGAELVEARNDDNLCAISCGHDAEG